MSDTHRPCPICKIIGRLMKGATLTPPEASVRLRDGSMYSNRFEVKSKTSDNTYTVSQSTTGRWWACSCPGWKTHKHCKHLKEFGLPGHYQPFELQRDREREAS